jgi:calpain-15
VLVDDYFPCYPDGHPSAPGPCFSRTKGHELWVLILEKAWAKLHGSYQNIISGMDK